MNLDDGFIRYEIGKETTNKSNNHQHHLISLNCIKSKKIGLEEDDHKVKLYGYCKECGGNIVEERTNS